MIPALPKVSIVTPSYNQDEHIENTILSVLDQSYENIEYIIIDGGSTDKSIDIINKYSDRISYWCSEPDNGQSHAINKGWRRANGDILAYLNSDDLLVQGAIKKIVNVFSKNDEVGIVFGDCRLINKVGEKIGVRRPSDSNYRKLLKYGQDKIAQPSTFFLGDLVRSVNYLDESLNYSMDYDLLLKLAKISKMHYIPEILAEYRIHTSTKSFTEADKHWKENFLVRKRYDDGFFFIIGIKYMLFRTLNSLPNQLELFFRRLRGKPKDLVKIDSFFNPKK